MTTRLDRASLAGLCARGRGDGASAGAGGLRLDAARRVSRARSCRPTTRCPTRRSSSGGICSTTRGSRGTARSRARTCHEQARAFTDGRARSVGSTGELHPRGSMSLVNVAYAAVADLGQSDADAARRSGARADVRRASDRAGAQPHRTRGSTRSRRDRALPAAVRRGLRRPTAEPVTRDNAREGDRHASSGRSCRRDRRTIAITSIATTRPSRRRRSAAKCCSTAGRCRASRVTAAFTSRVRWEARRDAMRGRVPQHRPLQPRRARCRIPRTNTGLYEVTHDAGGRRQVQGADAAQHRGHRAVHARRQRGHARRGDRSLRGRRAHDPGRPLPGRRPRQSATRARRFAASR